MFDDDLRLSTRDGSHAGGQQPGPGVPPPPVTEPNPDPADEPPPVIEPDPEVPEPAPEPPPMVA